MPASQNDSQGRKKTSSAGSVNGGFGQILFRRVSFAPRFGFLVRARQPQPQMQAKKLELRGENSPKEDLPKTTNETLTSVLDVASAIPGPCLSHGPGLCILEESSTQMVKSRRCHMGRVQHPPTLNRATISRARCCGQSRALEAQMADQLRRARTGV